jgi:glycosyltransferase involved in cell wall biosynthesis
LHAVHVLGETAAGHVLSLAGGLVARGVRVTVCGPAGTDAGAGFVAAGARFAPVEISRRAALRTDVAAITALRAACAGADVVHAHGLRAGLLCSIALGGRSTPLVAASHGAVFAQRAMAQVLRILERRVARSAAVVLGASSDLVDRARELGARDARLAPVGLPAAVRATALPPEKTRAEFGTMDRPLLLAVGRLETHKGYGPLLDAARAWRALEPQPVVVIAGVGRQRAELQHRIDVEHLPVRLLGHRDDVPELLAAADLVLLPSRWEARALIAQQALHAGVPLVATAVGGTPELVGDAAELVPYEDVDALADAVARLLADPTRRAELAAAGRAQAATWPTEDETVAQVLSVYDELASQAR